MPMESFWITTAAERHGHFSTEGVTEYRGMKDPWHKAEHTLRCSWDRYSMFGSAAALYRDAVIKPLHDRFNAGDRSFGLLCDILSL
jgi:hypothetical protein